MLPVLGICLVSSKQYSRNFCPPNSNESLYPKHCILRAVKPSGNYIKKIDMIVGLDVSFIV